MPLSSEPPSDDTQLIVSKAKEALTLWRAHAAREADVRLRLIALEHAMEAITHGYVDAGLAGANEKQREATLARLLSEDASYLAAFTEQETRRKEQSEASIEAKYWSKRFSLCLAQLAAQRSDP